MKYFKKKSTTFNHMRNYWYSWLGLLWSCSIWAQTPYHWNLTEEDGLPDMEIYDLYQDRKGYMWIATDGGLCKYDGQQLEYYNHPFQKRRSAAFIQEDAHGTIWYKNFSGQLFFIDSSNTVQLFEPPSALPLGTYFQYALTKDELVVNTSFLLQHYHFATQKWTADTLINSYQIKCLASIESMTTNDESSLAYIDCANEVWTVKNGQHQFLLKLPWGREITGDIIGIGTDSLLLYSNDRIYIKHLDDLHEFQTEDMIFTQEGIIRVFVNGNKILVCTSEGIIILSKSSKKNTWTIERQVGVKVPIGALQIDREGNLWVGTLGNGILVFPSLEVHYFNAQNSALVDTKISALAKTSTGELWIGAKGMIASMNTQSLQMKKHSLMDKRPVTYILPDEKRGQVLLGASKTHCLTLDMEEKMLYNKRYIGHHAILYKEDQVILGSFLFLCTYSLVKEPFVTKPPSYTFDKQVEHFVDKENEGAIIPTYWGMLSKKRVTALWADQTDTSRFWAGLNDSLFYWQNTVPHPVLAKNGQPIIPTKIIQTADSIVWVATSNQGVYGIKKEQAHYHFTVDNGLPSNNCKALALDSIYLWIGTDKGLVKLDPQRGESSCYDQLDGLISSNINYVEVANGKVWAATSKGLVSFDVHLPAVNKTAPLIHLKEWYVNDSLHAWDATTELSYAQNTLQFTFQALAFKSRNKHRYAYRLIGLNTTWIEQSSAVNFARFTNLDAGAYRFEVRASNEDGLWSVQTATFSFIIEQPYWETWWFKTSMGVAGLLVLLLFIRGIYLFVQRRQATQNLIVGLKMQALQAQMNPHFIFNAMSTIQSFWMYKEAKVALIYHAKFAKLMRLIFNYSNKTSIPIKDELEFLNLYIDLEKIRLKDEIKVTFDVDPVFEEASFDVPPLLIQPIIENSFKHGFLHKEQEGHLQIKLMKEGHYIHCIIEDDGVGRTATKTYQIWKDNHLKKQGSSFVTQERLDLLNRTKGKNAQKITFRITDLTNAAGEALGTKTELWIPIVDA